MRLVASLNGDIAFLLQKIVHVPFGGDLLIDSGILEALHTAADNYQPEESRVLDSQKQSTADDKVDVVTPSFLHGHLG